MTSSQYNGDLSTSHESAAVSKIAVIVVLVVALVLLITTVTLAVCFCRSQTLQPKKSWAQFAIPSLIINSRMSS